MSQVKRKLEALDFDNHSPECADNHEWWRQQDNDMRRQEIEQIEIAAEIQEYRNQGYM